MIEPVPNYVNWKRERKLREEMFPRPERSEEPMQSGYEYQEYPRVLYGRDGDTKTVRSDEEKDAAMSEGFALMPQNGVEHGDVIAQAIAPEPEKPKRFFGRKGRF